MPFVVPPPLTAGPSTSLLPIQIETNVGWASRAFWTCVLPPRTSVVSVFEALVDAVIGSSDVAPGTATLLRMSLPPGARNAHVAAGGDATVANAPGMGGQP